MKRIAIVIGLAAMVLAAAVGAQDYPSNTIIGVITAIDLAGPGQVTVQTPVGQRQFTFDMASNVIVEGSGEAGKSALKVGLPVRITATGDDTIANVDEIEVLVASDRDYKAAMAAAASTAAAGAASTAAAAATPDVAAAPMAEESVVQETMVEETVVEVSLPKTASPIPLLGVLGAAALAGAGLLRRLRA